MNFKLEADEVMVNEMKNMVQKEYYRRVRKVLETKLKTACFQSH